MTDTKDHSASETGSLQGRVFTPHSRGDLEQAIELAFDYRGDVTLGLKSGETLQGYLFNRSVRGAEAWIEVFPTASPDIRRLGLDEIATVAFSGEDTATGKSWENWVAKKESERKTEADRVAADAQARGHL